MLNNTQDQIEALEEVKSFLQSDKNLMLIRGKAGTGKTTLVRDIQDVAFDNEWKTIPLGVWGRSVASIIQLTGIPAMTVKKYIRINEEINDSEYKDFDDYYENYYSRRFKNAGKRIVDTIRNIFFKSRNEFNKTLLIIDEASTLTLETLEEAVRFTGFKLNTKVILLGDQCQLPASFDGEPVQLLDLDYWLENYDKEDFKVYKKHIELRVSHRVSENSPLYDLAEKLRFLTLTKLTGEESRKLILDSVNTEEVIYVGNVTSFNVFKKEQKLESIYIAGKEEVSAANEKLRSIYIENNKLEPSKIDDVKEGDILRARCNGMNETFMTGEEFLIEKIIHKTDNFTFAEVIVATRYKEFSLNIFRAFFQSIRNIFDSNKNLKARVAIYTPPVINNDNEKLFWNHERANMINSFENLTPSEVQESIYNSVDDVVTGTLGYAVTIEHSQGGEWDVIGLSLDIEGKQDIPKYWYTAVTRAKKKLYVFN